MAENIAHTDSGQAGPCGGNGWRPANEASPDRCLHVDQCAEINMGRSKLSVDRCAVDSEALNTAMALCNIKPT